MIRDVTSLCLLILLLAGCSDASAPAGRRVQQGELEREGALPVEVMQVESRDVVEWVREIGSVSADKSVTLAAEVGGRITRTVVDVGDLVEKGETLMQLDDERFRIARDMAKAEVKIARAQLEDSQRDARRQADLFEEAIISENDVQEANLDVSVNQGELAMAEAKLAAAERDLTDATVKSPISGKITRRHVEAGELVQPGSPLFDIVDTDRVKILVNISERDITKVRPWQDAEIEVDGYPGVTFQGKVYTIGTEADAETRTFPVEILAVNDRPEKLLPGFIGRVRIKVRMHEDAVFLPQELIIDRTSNPTVFVVASDKVSARPVRLGFEDHGGILISEGLNPGEKIVVSGQGSLRDGTRVIIK